MDSTQSLVASVERFTTYEPGFTTRTGIYPPDGHDHSTEANAKRFLIASGQTIVRQALGIESKSGSISSFAEVCTDFSRAIDELVKDVEQQDYLIYAEAVLRLAQYLEEST
jgi:hypothetical protein